ncbi:hypothetical protein V6N12_031428 [Hibiscus sabdariffa]|uniref:Uncharacterized protein n=1 Tax=Hibiscus sabdariffa TaxID=183260 RepID=A0ABR2B1X2_9ROSI
MEKSVLSGGFLNQENSALILGVLEMLGSGGIMSGGRSATCTMNNGPILSDHLRKPDLFDNLDSRLVSNTGPTLSEDGFIDSVPVVGVEMDTGRVFGPPELDSRVLTFYPT